MKFSGLILLSALLAVDAVGAVGAEIPQADRRSGYSFMAPEDHVRSIHVFNEKNPQPNIGNFHLGPHSGRAQVSTRIRLADSQKIVAIARLSDGSFWSVSVDVVVTLAACTDEVI